MPYSKETKMKKKMILFGVLLLALVLIYINFGQYFTLEYLKAQNGALQQAYRQNAVSFSLIYLLVYIFLAAISFPGATILNLVGGAIFGWLYGTVLVTIASTLGATLAFLSTRYLFGEFVQRKFQVQFRTINEGIESEGAFYLFSLRLNPVIPFFIINLAMGLTKMKTCTFFWVSLIGMIVSTVAYVKAGEEISKI